MGISNPMLIWLDRLYTSGEFSGKKSILDLGPQDLVLNKKILGETIKNGQSGNVLTRLFKKPRHLDYFHMNGTPNPYGMRALYRHWGLEEHFSLDRNDERADYRLDLNDAISLPRSFDVITNFGTAEHIFNVANVIKVIHDHLDVGGLSLHVLPTRGDYNHGFFNFHSTWFRDIAAANDYEIVNMVCVPDFGGQHYKMDEDANCKRPYTVNFIDVSKGDDQAEGDERFARTSYEHFSRRAQNPSVDPRVYEYIFAALRKTTSAPFRTPQQNHHESMTQ